MKASKGRFQKTLDPIALRFSSSLEIDKRLFREDIEGSIAHLRMLVARAIVPSAVGRKIHKALLEIRKELEKGTFRLPSLENGGRFAADDIHMAIEQRLVEKVGAIGGTLHTARSRNDQVALDERLYLRKTVTLILRAINSLQKTFLAQAGKYLSVVMPGYTHLQRAQPVLLAHHLLAYVSMLDRDRERFHDCLGRVNRSPLGAGALAGTSFPIDRQAVMKTLGLTALIENSIDAVSDRDVQIEFIAACAVTMMHLSRFAEDLVLWSSEEWRFAEIGETFATGSSIMPQKRNPDVAELVRGKAGRVFGDLIALLTVMKGLPFAYNRDMQEDKPALFDAADTLHASLEVFSKMFSTVIFREKRFEAEPDYLLATELADYLVRKGMPFRKAHTVVGAVVRECLSRNIQLKELPIASYRKYSTLFDRDIWKILHVRASLKLKRSRGSTSPPEVTKSLRSWSKKLRAP
jgi:argininosuccinate lyase